MPTRALVLSLLVAGVAIQAASRPVKWTDLPPAVARLLHQAGLTGETFPNWLRERAARLRQQLREGTAEHVGYYVLQSRDFTAEPRLDPLSTARAFERLATLPPEVERRLNAFWTEAPSTERHALLRAMAVDRPTSVHMAKSTFQFLLEHSRSSDMDALYQTRGLSADPFPGSMAAVERGLKWLAEQRSRDRRRVWLIGPGIELGSRFGLDDRLPIRSPQPGALLKLLPRPPDRYHCSDVRGEVVDSLETGPCVPAILDIVAGRYTKMKFDLAVATNVFVYLTDIELALALANVSDSLAAGGCLIHNDARFAARLFGEAVGLPAVQFLPVTLGRRNGAEHMDRAVIHCKSP